MNQVVELTLAQRMKSFFANTLGLQGGACGLVEGSTNQHYCSMKFKKSADLDRCLNRFRKLEWASQVSLFNDQLPLQANGKVRGLSLLFSWEE